MHATQKRFIEQRYRAGEWYGRGMKGRRVIKDLRFEGSEILEWTLDRMRRDEHARPPAIRSLWRHDEPGDELLAIDVFECASHKAAHDQLIETLGEIESGAVERRTGKNLIGDVAFGLNDTMVLFARANLVVWVRNAGRKIVRVGAIAAALDQILLSRVG